MLPSLRSAFPPPRLDAVAFSPFMFSNMAMAFVLSALSPRRRWTGNEMRLWASTKLAIVDGTSGSGAAAAAPAGPLEAESIRAVLAATMTSA